MSYSYLLIVWFLLFILVPPWRLSCCWHGLKIINKMFNLLTINFLIKCQTHYLFEKLNFNKLNDGVTSEDEVFHPRITCSLYQLNACGWRSASRHCSSSCILNYSCISFCGVSNRINHKQYFPCGRNCFQILLNSAAEKHEEPQRQKTLWSDLWHLNVSHPSFASNIFEWSQSLWLYTSNQWTTQRALTLHLHSLGFQKYFPIDFQRLQQNSSAEKKWNQPALDSVKY